MYERFRNISSSLIEKYGQKVTWRQVRNGTPPDPELPHIPGDSVNVDFTNTPIIFLPQKNEGKESERFSRPYEGTQKRFEVHAGNIQGLMGPVSFVPTIKDVVLRGTELLRIDSIQTIQPNEESAILYKVKFK